jgi:hypothetical protein
MSSALPALEIGDLQLYDYYKPQLTGGNYEITVTHELGDVDTGTLAAAQSFTVSAPQVALDPSELIQLYPPNGSTGQYADALPFAVLAEPTLPWERAMPDAVPWLALLVLTEDELIGGTSPTGATTTTVADFLALTDALVPQLALEDDVTPNRPCDYIKVSTQLFRAIVPRADELRYMAHVRQANTSDRAASHAGDQTLFSVVVSSRFPAAGADPVKNVVHLVSLESLSGYLGSDAVFTRSGKADGSPVYDSIALLSLASWTFQALPEPAGSFEGLTIDLLYSEYDPAIQTHTPDALWLRLPPPDVDENDVNAAQAARRIADGYVPTLYHTRTGEETFAWYRGPLTPMLPERIDKPGPFLTADAALAYDPTHGLFDCSLAAAWQIGRATAIADSWFARTLLDLRRKLHVLTDLLYDRLVRDHFDTPDDIRKLVANGQLTKTVLGVLDAELLRDLGRGPGPGPITAPAIESPDADPSTTLNNFLSEETTQDAILDLVGEDLGPVAEWLARLSLLYSIPFTYLVPSSAMLPVESPAAENGRALAGSVRFFYVDPNWIGALLDGALSIGLESSLHTFLNDITSNVLQDAAAEAARELRASIVGVAPPNNEPGAAGVRCGFLLRSPVVSGWPNLAVRCVDGEGALLRTLRSDRLAPGVLLCLFDGVPTRMSIGEPQEGVRFGVDAQGMVELRNLIAPKNDSGPPIGAPLGTTLPARDLTGEQQLLMRAAGSRVLNIAPSSNTGLVQSLVASLAQLNQPVSVDNFGAAAFALQMIDAPQRLSFDAADAT